MEPPEPSGRSILSMRFPSSSLGFSGETLKGSLAAVQETRDFPSESASSRETSPAAEQNGSGVSMDHQQQNKEELAKDHDQAVMHRIGSLNAIALKDVAFGPVDAIAARMQEQPDELSEDLKAELRDVLNGTEMIQHKEDFALLQKKVLTRRDLSPDSLIMAHKAQLEILVAIKTGIPAFLHPDIAVTQTILIEILLYKRCRNMACQNQLPGDDCACDVCISKSGFCNACMCTICCKFDFDVNTCRWIGCDFCSHWAHTDCAIRVGQIAMGPLSRGGGAVSGMLFKCGACKNTSQLLGWVKDVFCTCAGGWEGEELLKEFDCVLRIFLRSEDSKGKRLFRKSEEMLEKLKSGVDGSLLCKELQTFFQALEAEDIQDQENEGMKMAEPFEACSRIAEVVQEAMSKMDTLAGEKVRALKKARVALEACESEVVEKKKELQDLQVERQRNQQQLNELEAIVRLKVAEADMFQAHADKARNEAEELQLLAADKFEKVEEEYTARYLKLRLNEVEAERRTLFEKIQMQHHIRVQPDASQMLMVSKIQDLLKQVYSKNEADECYGANL